MSIQGDVRAILHEITDGIERDRQVFMNNRLKAQSALLEAIAVKVADGDQAILDAIAGLKAADDEGEVDQ
jgi:hypothetical protein